MIKGLLAITREIGQKISIIIIIIIIIIYLFFIYFF